MAPRIFIDGEAGTTGLQIAQRLNGRSDIELLHLDNAERKDPKRRAEMLNNADVSILCLPDDAAIEAVAMVENDDARIIDASVAHRVSEGWTYGFAEYDRGQRDAIAASKRVTNPGCYSCAAIAMLHPLVSHGVLPEDFAATINAVSGYSGGGKSLIASFEDPEAPNATDSEFYLYGLSLEHKHVPEIHKYSSLANRPIFVPSVGRFYQGMIVSLPLQLWALPGEPTASRVHAALSEHYTGQTAVNVAPLEDTEAFRAKLDPEMLNATDRLEIHVFGSEKHKQAVVCAVLDNLGKGASGQAVQNMNIMLGLPEDAGLAGK